MKNFEIICPCCEALIVVDRLTGEVLLHKAKEKKSGQSLEAMVSGLETQKSEMAKRFDKEMESQKNRSILVNLCMCSSRPAGNLSFQLSRQEGRQNAKSHTTIERFFCGFFHHAHALPSNRGGLGKRW